MDAQYRDATIKSVPRGTRENGWQIEMADGWSFMVPPNSPVEPAPGMTVRLYGKGIGYPVRGMALDGVTVFYRTAAEDDDHRKTELYGADAADLLARWDNGGSVFSIEMGGFGPGYEQALQIAAFERLRDLLAGGSSDEFPSRLEYLGLSGNQWGAAKYLARRFHVESPRAVLESVDDARHIQVSRNFPQAPALPA